MTDTPARDPHSTLVALFSVTHTPEQAQHAAKTVLDLHAHYLADQIRNRDYDPGAVEPVHLTVQADADLIDPEPRR